MTEITATEADARGLSALLDEIERSGETFVITRNGRRIATFLPAPTGSARALLDVLQRHEPDPDFGRDIALARALMEDYERSWPV